MTKIDKKLAQLKKAFESGILDEDTYTAAVKALAGDGNETNISTGEDAVFAKDRGKAYAIKGSQIGVAGDHTKVEGDIKVYADKTDPESLRRQYLQDLAIETNRLPWVNVDPDYADPERGESLGLADIYTTLDTTEIGRPETEDEVREHLQWATGRISAQEMISREEKLVLLGDPGSGKSTFVNYLTHIMAQAGRSRNPDEWLNRLENTGIWEHGVLLPVRVILREFVAGLDKNSQPGPDLLLSYLEANLKTAMKDFWKSLYEGLAEPETPYLILLDGLDEVPPELRRTVVTTVSEFAEKYKEHRYLVTCRIYAYIGQNYQLQGFRQATLFPFSREQIESFVSAWYRELAARGRFTEKEAGKRAERLKYAATRLDLIGLAERPLLITAMALLHTFRGQLPEDRVELYQGTVDLLLRRWESRMGGEKGIIETLNIPGLKMNRLEAGLYNVAFRAHAGHNRRGETADIREADLREHLAPCLNNDWNKAGDFICYVRERAGLLIRHKPDAYTFPHRTFQEFMAACHLVVGTKDYPGEAARLVREDGNKWHIVFILAAGYAARTHREVQAVSSVNALYPAEVSESKPNAAAYHRLEIAVEALMEIGLLYVKGDDVGRAVLNRVRRWMAAALQADDVLGTEERVSLGNTLAVHGDPRFNPGNWYLPDDDELGFVRIPAGKFLMGRSHTVELSEYSVARYPVTVAQFGSFVQDSGYQPGEDWEEDNEYDNHPVVNVSWHDAAAYCEWLTEKLKDRRWKVQLPTEAQWEKAAGGTDGRIYPWGDEADPDKANCDDTGIGTTSAVGCFPAGASPYGCLDMAGNLWEWCRDRYDGYSSGRVSNPAYPNTGSHRVRRGGAWNFSVGFCRAASRIAGCPDSRFRYHGFRLVRLPSQQDG
ncbi:SUMF1/EgtB/PvdO family nonheme iron enzyme [Desulfobacterales bacterium HSG2]|nr:SUMF1/EgtB/PvdO family nonheme iron enzyme [Desulfobacterales bacterium HSG2]